MNSPVADPSVVAITTPAHAAADVTPTPAAAPAPSPTVAGSPLGTLQARAKKMAELLHTDMRVPRWGELDGGPAIYVRYGPASPSEFSEKFERLQKQPKKPKDWAVVANAQVLVSSCLEVFSVEGDEPYDGDADPRSRLSLRDGDPHGGLTRFDPDLAHSLGLAENCGAVAVVRALYLTEADITSTANALLQWSGLVLPGANRDFSGS